jgi:hypothetical protein
MAERQETTDGRYVRMADGQWWDTTSTEIVSEATVDEYMRTNRVGIVIVYENTIC